MSRRDENPGLSRLIDSLFNLIFIFAVWFYAFNVIKNINNTISVTDSIFFHEVAVYFSQFNRFAFILRSETYAPTVPIGYPLLLGILYKFIGPVIAAGKIFNMLFFIGALFLLRQFIGKQLGSFVAVTGSLFLLLLFSYSVDATELMADAALIFFVSASFYLYFLKHKNYGPFFSGCCAGFAMLIKMLAIFSVLSIFFWEMILFISKKDKLSYKKLIPFCLGFLPFLFIYFISNYLLYGSPFVESYLYNQKLFNIASIISGHGILPDIFSKDIVLRTGRYLFNLFYIKDAPAIRFLLMNCPEIFYWLINLLVGASFIFLLFIHKNKRFILFLLIMLLTYNAVVSFSRLYVSRYNTFLYYLAFIAFISMIQEIIGRIVPPRFLKLVLLGSLVAFLFAVQPTRYKNCFIQKIENTYHELDLITPVNTTVVTPLYVNTMYFTTRKILDMRAMTRQDLARLIASENSVYLVFPSTFRESLPEPLSRKINSLMRGPYKQAAIDAITSQEVPYTHSMVSIKYPQIPILYRAMLDSGEWELVRKIGKTDIYKKKQKPIL